MPLRDQRLERARRQEARRRRPQRGPLFEGDDGSSAAALRRWRDQLRPEEWRALERRARAEYPDVRALTPLRGDAFSPAAAATLDRAISTFGPDLLRTLAALGDELHAPVFGGAIAEGQVAALRDALREVRPASLAALGRDPRGLQPADVEFAFDDKQLDQIRAALAPLGPVDLGLFHDLADLVINDRGGERPPVLEATHRARVDRLNALRAAVGRCRIALARITPDDVDAMLEAGALIGAPGLAGEEAAAVAAEPAGLAAAWVGAAHAYLARADGLFDALAERLARIDGTLDRAVRAVDAHFKPEADARRGARSVPLDRRLWIAQGVIRIFRRYNLPVVLSGTSALAKTLGLVYESIGLPPGDGGIPTDPQMLRRDLHQVLKDESSRLAASSRRPRKRAG